jgi:hypothetical protein
MTNPVQEPRLSAYIPRSPATEHLICRYLSGCSALSRPVHKLA